MNTENKDWKPEVGKTAWLMAGSRLQEVKCLGNFWSDEIEVLFPGFGKRHVKICLLFPTAEAALASIKVYDIHGKEVVVTRPKRDQIPSQTSLLVSEIFALNIEVERLSRPVKTLAQAQMLLYEHGFMADLSGLNFMLIERGPIPDFDQKSANGGESPTQEDLK